MESKSLPHKILRKMKKQKNNPPQYFHIRVHAHEDESTPQYSDQDNVHVIEKNVKEGPMELHDESFMMSPIRELKLSESLNSVPE